MPKKLQLTPSKVLEKLNTKIKSSAALVNEIGLYTTIPWVSQFAKTLKDEDAVARKNKKAPATLTKPLTLKLFNFLSLFLAAKGVPSFTDSDVPQEIFQGSMKKAAFAAKFQESVDLLDGKKSLFAELGGYVDSDDDDDDTEDVGTERLDETETTSSKDYGIDLVELKTAKTKWQANYTKQVNAINGKAQLVAQDIAASNNEDNDLNEVHDVIVSFAKSDVTGFKNDFADCSDALVVAFTKLIEALELDDDDSRKDNEVDKAKGLMDEALVEIVEFYTSETVQDVLAAFEERFNTFFGPTIKGLQPIALIVEKALKRRHSLSV